MDFQSGGALEDEIPEAQLMRMSADELKAYMSRISTMIEQEQDGIKTLEVQKDGLDKDILNTESTVKSYDQAVQLNSAFQATLERESQAIASTIAGYNSSIFMTETEIKAQQAIIAEADSALSTITKESADLDTAQAAADAKFIEDAKFYSTLYLNFLKESEAYTALVANIELFSTQVVSSITAEQVSAKVLEDASRELEARQAELKALNDVDAQLQVVLNQSKTEEALAQQTLTSSIAAVESLQKLYETAQLNSQYYDKLAIQGQKTEAVTRAQASLSQAQASLAQAPTDSVRISARDMAAQALTTAQKELADVKAEVAELGKNLSKSSDNSYEALLNSIQADIDAEDKNISTFTQYRVEAERNIQAFSTQMVQALTDAAAAQKEFETYTSAYTSTTDGIAALRTLESQQRAVIAAADADISAFDKVIGSLTTELESQTSSLTAFTAISTQLNEEYVQASKEFEAFSAYYESTNTAVFKLETEQKQVNSDIAANETLVRVLGRTEEQETITIQRFDTEAQAAFLDQEKSTYEYRETYVRQKRVAQQQAYEALVSASLESASTLTGQGRPTVPNLDTPEMQAAYKSFTGITSFLDKFNTLYAAYNNTLNAQAAVTKSLSDKSIALSSVAQITDLLTANPADENQKAALSQAQSRVSAADSAIAQATTDTRQTSGLITQMKEDMSTTFASIFTPFERYAQESTISSILKAALEG
jgi:chromosome segregation ATPase